MDDIEYFDYLDSCNKPDWHAVNTIQLCELIDADFFDLSRDDWDFGPKYSIEQHTKLCNKITDHFYYREIGLTPPGIWKREFLRTMNEIMPKYIPLYKLLDESPSLFSADSEYYKSRNIYSDFPQTQLNGNNGDYASTGNDMEFERIRQMNIIDAMERMKTYKDIDLMIIDEIEPLFSCLFTINVNAF